MASPIYLKGYLVDDKGTWTVRARYTDPVSGRKKVLSKSTGFKVDGHNRRKAETAMREIVAGWEREASGFHAPENPLIKDCVLQWLEKRRLDIRPNTLESYRGIAEKHIIPKLGEIRIGELSRIELQQYFEELHDDGLSVSTLKKHRLILLGILHDAVLDDLIQVNVADYIRLPKNKRFEGKALSEHQVADVLAKLEDQPEPIRAAVTLAVVYGLRRSEICGLRWEDVDFDNSVIHICNTVTEYNGVTYEGETTKTKASRRDLYLIQSTAEYLKALQVTQRRSGIYNGKVCGLFNGHDVRPEYISRACKRFLIACGFDDIRIHDLRHTAATILAKRVPVKQVQAFLGHEDAQTTLNIYTHVQSEDRKKTSEAMEEFLYDAGVIKSCGDCSENCSENTVKSQGKVVQLFPQTPEMLEKA